MKRGQRTVYVPIWLPNYFAAAVFVKSEPANISARIGACKYPWTVMQRIASSKVQPQNALPAPTTNLARQKLVSPYQRITF
jgi:hypothetical protein